MTTDLFADLPLDNACPDCDADTMLTEQSPRVFVLEIRHDTTCPTYCARRARGDAA